MTIAPALTECRLNRLVPRSADPLVDESPLVAAEYVDRHVHHLVVLVVRESDDHDDRLPFRQFQEVCLVGRRSAYFDLLDETSGAVSSGCEPLVEHGGVGVRVGDVAIAGDVDGDV